MLKAKLDSIRKNKKGFSLVELIIVVAIMVALIAVLAPGYVKYVNRSRNAALQTAAEDLATAIKTEIADPETTYKKPKTDVIFKVSNSTGVLVVAANGSEDADLKAADVIAIGNIEGTKAMKAGDVDTLYIQVTTDGNVKGPQASATFGTTTETEE